MNIFSRIVAVMFFLFSSVSFALALPEIVIIGTGGTISGSAQSKKETINYAVGSVPVSKLYDDIPEINSIAKIRTIQFSQIDSQNMDLEYRFNLLECIRNELSKPETDGVVITHGTDTMENTAYFLDLTLNTEKPVILVGAMRPSTAYSADGSLNLIDAVTVAASPKFKGCGVAIVMNDTIFSAKFVRKAHTARPDAFSEGMFGILGSIISGHVSIYKKITARHTFDSEFNEIKYDNIPQVDIIYADDTQVNVIEDSIRRGAKGIVLMCAGDGSVPNTIRERIKKLSGDGFPIVRSTVIPFGEVMRNGEVNDDEFQTIPSGAISAHKARILLTLCLMKKMNLKEITRVFETY